MKITPALKALKNGRFRYSFITALVKLTELVAFQFLKYNKLIWISGSLYMPRIISSPLQKFTALMSNRHAHEIKEVIT